MLSRTQQTLTDQCTHSCGCRGSIIPHAIHTFETQKTHMLFMFCFFFFLLQGGGAAWVQALGGLAAATAALVAEVRAADTAVELRASESAVTQVGAQVGGCVVYF